MTACTCKVYVARDPNTFQSSIKTIRDKDCEVHGPIPKPRPHNA